MAGGQRVNDWEVEKGMLVGSVAESSQESSDFLRFTLIVPFLGHSPDEARKITKVVSKGKEN